MLDIVLSNAFKKDLKLTAKRGYNLELLNTVIEKLANQETLEDKYRDHALTGNYSGFRECHIQPDWLMIWEQDDTQLTLLFLQTGTHSDLF